MYINYHRLCKPTVIIVVVVIGVIAAYKWLWLLSNNKTTFEARTAETNSVSALKEKFN